MPSQGLVGRAGQSFAKVLVDAEGTLQVPHYKAADILRDNRIPWVLISLCRTLISWVKGAQRGQ